MSLYLNGVMAEPVVPAKNGAQNIGIRDVVGNKLDDEAGDSLYSKAHIVDAHNHSAQKVYPTGAAGVQAVAGTPAWTLGAYKEVMPAGSTVLPFDIHWVFVSGAVGAGTYELVLYAATTEIGRVRLTVTGTPNNFVAAPQKMQTPILPAGTQVQAKLMTSSGNADSLTFSLGYHLY